MQSLASYRFVNCHQHTSGLLPCIMAVCSAGACCQPPWSGAVQMKEAVNEEHEGRRKNELTWKINRIHWEKNRFIYDLMYQRKVRPPVQQCVPCLHPFPRPLLEFWVDSAGVSLLQLQPRITILVQPRQRR